MVNTRLNVDMEISETRRANLRRLITERSGGNATRFGELIGRQQSYVSDLLSGRKSFGEKIARAIESRLGLPTSFLDMQPSEATIETAEFEPGPDLPSYFRKVPVVGTAQLGPDGYWEQDAYLAGKGEGYIEHATRDPDAYALRVKGDSMSPAIRSGWLVVVEPNTACVPGSFVVVRTDSGRSMVKEFLYERDGEVALASVNDAYGRLTLDRSEIVSLHVIGAIIPPHKFKPW